MNKPTQKQKSHKRFQQVNALIDVVAPKLGNPTLIAVLLVCWRHADERGYFELSFGRIATSAGVSRRNAIRAIQALVSAQAIKTVAVGSGIRASRYRFSDPDQVIDQRTAKHQKGGDTVSLVSDCH
jgi:hypothetical protein